MTRQDIPNIISWLRIGLTFPVIWFLFAGQFATAMILFALASVSDALDGFLAKRYQWQSRFGSILDPLADKLLLVSSFIALTSLGLLPAWLLWAVLARDTLIVAGGWLYHCYLGQFDLIPLWSSRINTTLQMIIVLLVITQQYFMLPELVAVIDIVVWLVLASVINSGTEYIVVWGLRALRKINDQ